MTPEMPQTDPTAGASPLEERLVAYLDGELPPEEARQVEQLLAADSQARGAMERLERSWRLLDDLDQADAGEEFTRTTLEMVAVSAEEDASQDRSVELRRHRLRWTAGILGILAAGLAGFVLVVVLRPDPARQQNRQLLRDLPVIEDLDEYRQVDDLEFLRLLDQDGVFAKEPGDEG